MAHAVISGVLEQLRSILQTGQVNLLAGVRKESEKLNDTLLLIQGVLEDAEEKEVKNGAVKAWLEQLTRISYDADDVLDDWKTEILSSQIQLLDDHNAPVSEKLWSCLFSLFSCLKSVVVRHDDDGSKMIDINERLDRIVKDKALLDLNERQSREEPRPVTSSFVDASEIYGRVDDIYSIVSMLLTLREIEDDREKFEEIGKKIAWKCKGVPLAVKIIASLMRRKRSVVEWEDVLASNIWEEMSKDEHAEIDKDELVKLWMAQGFLGYDSSKDLEKTGTNYFNDLAMRSLFQDFRKDSEGNVIGCKMHDLVHDFARYLTKSDSSIFMKNDREVCNIRLRHFGAAIWECTSAHLKLIICQMTCLRVLDLSGIFFREELPDEVERLLHLRLLNLSFNIEMKKLPETVCNLFNLQTLKLNGCEYLIKLPEGIGKLRNLRHLELEGTYQLNSFPRGLERLSFLRTLSTVVLDCDGGKGCQIGELKLLDHIQGELRIEGLGQVADSIEAVLKKKEKLRSLALVFSEERQDAAAGEEKRKRIESVLDGLQPHTNLAELKIQAYGGNSFPLWLSSINTDLPNLVKLELRDCNRCSELPALGRLQNLEHLELWGLGSVKRIGCEFYGLGSTDGTSTGGEDSVVVFPKLHTLKIYNMEECEESHMPFGRGVEVFPKLRKLIVINLMKLQMLPPGLGKLKYLEELILRRVGLVLFGLISRNTDDDNVTLISAQEEEGFIMPCLRELQINSCPKLKVVPHYLFSPALRSLMINDCPQLTGRQPCLPPLLEKLELYGDTGILSKSISGIGSPDHNENDYPNLHSFSIISSEESSLPQGFNQLTAIQSLEFQYCNFLDFTPEDLKHLPMLQRLEIRSCPILEERCRKRESWTTNSHIPKIELNYGDFILE
ncbi:hypothetical protein IFM89_034380 [Coptis chinensis]|uniref:Uncharacterized protein n=1 Tax=Coptis chinensis TaxID=261450 RepID=A0A835IYI7_9MAGN|nr:hypothetical protein IFM89_034380 [Coptis chinensis]